MDEAIRVQDLMVDRAGSEVLRGISFAVPKGSVAGLLGPSGCGKTTLIRSIVGVQVVRSGSVQVLGEPAGSPALRRSVRYLTQAPSIYGDLSAAENTRYFARAEHARSTVEAQRARDCPGHGAGIVLFHRLLT